MPRPQTANPGEIVGLFLDAYGQGAFPMADFGRSRRARAPVIHWYSPDPRAILPLEPGAFHVPRSLKRLVRTPPFVLTSDTCFERVIRACAEPRAREQEDSVPWLDESLIRAYCLIHQAGHAHSIEAWLPPSGAGARTEPVLAGGIYGVHIGAAFFAESMFCRPQVGGTNASNLCLVRLVAHLRARGFCLLDVQIANPHTTRFGVVEIPRAEYLRRLQAATAARARWEPFEPQPN